MGNIPNSTIQRLTYSSVVNVHAHPVSPVVGRLGIASQSLVLINLALRAAEDPVLALCHLAVAGQEVPVKIVGEIDPGLP